MSWHLLQRFFDSDVFNANPFLPVSYLSRYADHVGIHYALCQKLRQFPYEDIEFFLPQLCHLIISVDNESMALEEFLMDLCEESVTAALLTFWFFQTYLHDLSSNPQSGAFQTCRRVFNKVQHIVFGLPDAARQSRIRDNVLPVTVLSSFVLAGVGLPLLPRWAGPLAVAQARKPSALASGDVNAELQENGSDVARLSRAHTVSAGSSKSSRPSGGKPSRRNRHENRVANTPDYAASSPDVSALKLSQTPPYPLARKQPHLDMTELEGRLSSSSLPLPDLRPPTRPDTSLSAGPPHRPAEGLLRRHSHRPKAATDACDLSPTQRMRLLRQHYFRSETQFLTALEGISNRLVMVPKLARLSALRAELALIAQDLPAEIDIPVICPPTLVNGAPGKSRHHRIVRLNPAESTVLNSAEKVPYLLMVEVLRDDFSFDPDSTDNLQLLGTLLNEGGATRRIFDLSQDSPRVPQARTASRTQEPVIDSVFEPSLGDLGNSPMLKPLEDMAAAPTPTSTTAQHGPRHHYHHQHHQHHQHPLHLHTQPWIPSAGTTATAITTTTTATATSTAHSDLTTMSRSSGTGASTSRSSSPGPSHRLAMPPPPRATIVVPEPPDFSALATHMRTASQMLAQLEATSGKRPRQEVEAIRARIIASMQSLEEKSFDMDDGGPTFETIMAKAASANANAAGGQDNTAADGDGDDEASLESPVNANAGLARMENDIKTGGLQRKGDRDDPSAAVFGEAWSAKKERIRRTSPYGWMKNWDLVSVIVKTGADLRQEAFACQLISVCHKIWLDAGVDVWVKLMRILVTGESSGLIETITNGVSLHSIKRNLTLDSIASGQNPRRRFATLRDHFMRAFGPADGLPHRAGVDAFKRSLAAYSVISYVLQLKDRHNGNVLIDSEGHIVHIDFGFMLSNSPGSVGFEAAPFKLTHEYVEVLGGLGSADWQDYKMLCKKAFQALRRSADNIIDLVAMMGLNSRMPCFAVGVAQATASLRQRFQLHLSADEAEHFMEDLIAKSCGSYFTRLYDTFQYRTQGIY